jgi:hypothetical protein
MRKSNCIRGLRHLYAALQSSPACKPVFTRDGKLSVAQGQMGSENFGVGGFRPAGMELAKTLRDGGVVREMALQQIFGLVSQMV